jgi:hypothetical protein
MSHDLQDNTAEKDIATNWVSSSRFFFYVSIFAILALVLGNCSQLYNSRFVKPNPEVQSSSQYKPEYK